MLNIDEIDCNIDEDVDDEKFTGKNINNSFINRPKDFSLFHPSGKRGREQSDLSPHTIKDGHRYKRGSTLNF